MKHCIECEFLNEDTQQNPQTGQFVKILSCGNEEGSDPVTGTPLPCNYCRSNESFCGIKGRLWKKKEAKESASLLQMVKS